MIFYVEDMFSVFSLRIFFMKSRKKLFKCVAPPPHCVSKNPLSMLFPRVTHNHSNKSKGQYTLDKDYE